MAKRINYRKAALRISCLEDGVLENYTVGKSKSIRIGYKLEKTNKRPHKSEAKRIGGQNENIIFSCRISRREEISELL